MLSIAVGGCILLKNLPISLLFDNNHFTKIKEAFMKNMKGSFFV